MRHGVSKVGGQIAIVLNFIQVQPCPGTANRFPLSVPCKVSIRGLQVGLKADPSLSSSPPSSLPL